MVSLPLCPPKSPALLTFCTSFKVLNNSLAEWPECLRGIIRAPWMWACSFQRGVGRRLTAIKNFEICACGYNVFFSECLRSQWRQVCLCVCVCPCAYGTCKCAGGAWERASLAYVNSSLWPCHFTLTLAAWGGCSWAGHLCWRHSGHSDTSYQWHRPFQHTSMSSLWRSWRPVKGNRWGERNAIISWNILSPSFLCVPHPPYQPAVSTCALHIWEHTTTHILVLPSMWWLSTDCINFAFPIFLKVTPQANISNSILNLIASGPLKV